GPARKTIQTGETSMRSRTTSTADIFRGRVLKVAWQVFLYATGLARALPAMAFADSAHFDIPAEGMPAALKAFAAQAHMQLLYQYDAVKNAHGNAISGDLDKHAALEQLLRNSGL